MKLLNLDLDDLHLRGRYTGLNFTFNLGDVINYKNLNIKNNVFIESFVDYALRTWEGVYDNRDLLCNRYDFKINDGYKPNSIIDNKIELNKGYNILFTGLYSPDCKVVNCDFELGCSELSFKHIKVLGCGVLPNTRGSVSPNMILVIPDNCDYAIGRESNRTIYSGRTGNPISKTRNKLWFSVDNLPKVLFK